MYALARTYLRKNFSIWIGFNPEHGGPKVNVSERVVDLNLSIAEEVLPCATKLAGDIITRITWLSSKYALRTIVSFSPRRKHAGLSSGLIHSVGELVGKYDSEVE